MPPSAAVGEALLEGQAQACPVQAPLQVAGKIVQGGMRLASARRSLLRGQYRLLPAGVQPQDTRRTSQGEAPAAPRSQHFAGHQQETPQERRLQRLAQQQTGSRRHLA